MTGKPDQAVSGRGWGIRFEIASALVYAVGYLGLAWLAVAIGGGEGFVIAAFVGFFACMIPMAVWIYISANN